MEEIHEFTSADLIAALRAVVAERPDYVYEAPESACGSCMYVHDDDPGCGVGAALARLGVPLEQLAQHEYQNADDVIPAISSLVRDDPAVTLARMFQQGQDSGYTWGRSLQLAERETRG